MSLTEPVDFRLHRWRMWFSVAIMVALAILLIRGLALVAAAVGVPADLSDYIEADRPAAA